MSNLEFLGETSLRLVGVTQVLAGMGYQTLEVQGEGTVVSPEQQSMAANGRYPLVRSVEEAVRAVLTPEGAMSEYRINEERRGIFHRFFGEN